MQAIDRELPMLGDLRNPTCPEDQYIVLIRNWGC